MREFLERESGSMQNLENRERALEEIRIRTLQEMSEFEEDLPY